MSRLALGVAVVAALLAFAAPALAADHLYGITPPPTPHLVSFESDAPGVLTSDRAIGGFATGPEVVAGMDVSPRDGELYVLTRDGTVGRLYVLEPASAGLTLVGQLFDGPNDPTALDNTDFEVDFIPPSNLLRVVSLTGQNLRVNPANALVTTDTNIHGGVPPGASLSGIAFHNNDNDPLTMTEEYAYDATPHDDWGKVNTPNSGQWVFIADSGVTTQSPDGTQLDESPSGHMWAPHLVGGNQAFYEVVNLGTPGTHNLVATIPVNLVAMAAASPNLIGVEATDITAGEGAGAARVTVVRRNPRGSATFQVATSDATAKAGEDYSGVVSITPITFGPGEVAKTVSVPINDDSSDEPNESFDVTVSSPLSSEGAALMVDRKTTVSIADDDPAPAAAPDRDGDGVPDATDNCANVANAGQQDGNGNGLGTACDPAEVASPPAPDRDADGKPDSTDNCPNVANAGQEDADCDGLGTVCDPVEPVPPLVGKCANQRQGSAGEDALMGTAGGGPPNRPGG